jgi:hypothetical protein
LFDHCFLSPELVRSLSFFLSPSERGSEEKSRRALRAQKASLEGNGKAPSEVQRERERESVRKKKREKKKREKKKMKRTPLFSATRPVTFFPQATPPYSPKPARRSKT